MKVGKLTLWLRRLLPLDPCGAVIVAAGSASRMGGVDKILAKLRGEPVICHTVRAFSECEAITEIVIVTREDRIVAVSDLCAQFPKVKAVVAGGASRQESVWLGLNALSGVRLAAVHDGARPLVTWQLIDRVVRAAYRYGAAAPAVPVKDTIKAVRGGVVAATPDRKKLMAVQTPQVFDFDLLRAALHRARGDGAELTDDCAAVERLGFAVKIVEGARENIKITTPEDLKIAETLMEGRQ